MVVQVSGRGGRETVGVVSAGYHIPEGTVTSREMAEWSGIPVSVFEDKIGVLRKHVAGPDEHPAYMGTMAARKAISAAGIDADEIDIVAYCSLGYTDYRFWSPAAKVQDAVGAVNAYAFEVRNGCNGGNFGLHLCRELLLGDPEKRYALVVASDKLSMVVNYRNLRTVSGFSFADGAAAVILKKGCPGNSLLSYASVTDGSLVDFVKVPFGGTRLPPDGPLPDFCDRFFSVTDPEGLDAIFARTYLEQYGRVIGRALAASGYTTADISFIITNQVKRSLSRSILEMLGLSEDKTMVTMSEYGHMGPVDTLFGLAKALEEGRIHQGDLVVLAGSAIGFTWAATVLKFHGERGED